MLLHTAYTEISPAQGKQEKKGGIHLNTSKIVAERRLFRVM